MHEFNLLYTLITIVCVLGVIMGACAFLIFVERKIAAYVQDRLGPNRVGPRGLLQSVADGLKFLLKEDIVPDRVDKVLYFAAPAIALSTALLAFAVVPFGPTSVPGSEGYATSYQFVVTPGADIGILFTFAVSSLAVYAIILGGYAGNNKYSFLGGLRSSAQFVSYEIPLGLSILGVVLMSGSLNLERVIGHQATTGIWNIALQPLAFLLFLISSFAECNRLPFDLPEAEQELVGGYHTEYSAFKFALFFLGEYAHMITTSFLMVILFFGGWHFWGVTPWSDGLPVVLGAVVKLVIFGFKASLLILFYIVVRWTLPRFRFDQLMGLAWRVLIPLALVNLVCVMVVLEFGLPLWVMPVVTLAALLASGLLAARMPPPAERRVVVTRGHRQVEAVAR